MSSNAKRKRGRPRKTEQVEEGPQVRNEDDTFHQTGPYANTSSSGAVSAQPDNLTDSTPQTRYSEALADNKDAFGVPSRLPSQDDKMDLSENTGFTQRPIDAEISHRAKGMPDEAFTSQSPVRALEQYSQQVNLSPGNNLPEMVATADSDMPNAALLDTKPSENIEATFIAQHENSSVVFNEYKVKKEIVPLLNAIFTKYGDIAKNSTFSMESRSFLLELVCGIYKRLQSSKFMQLTSLELQSMLRQIGDLELVKVEVGWLHMRVLSISKARQLYDNVSTFKDVEERMGQEIDEKKIVVESCERELESCMATVKKLEESLNQEKDELLVAMALVDELKVFSEGSLVEGLV